MQKLKNNEARSKFTGSFFFLNVYENDFMV